MFEIYVEDFTMPDGSIVDAFVTTDVINGDVQILEIRAVDEDGNTIKIFKETPDCLSYLLDASSLDYVEDKSREKYSEWFFYFNDVAKAASRPDGHYV